MTSWVMVGAALYVGWVARDFWDHVSAPWPGRRPAEPPAKQPLYVLTGGSVPKPPPREEDQLCARCGHVRGLHAEGLHECLAYHELRGDWTNVKDAIQPCSCPMFVAVFSDPPAAA